MSKLSRIIVSTIMLALITGHSGLALAVDRGGLSIGLSLGRSNVSYTKHFRATQFSDVYQSRTDDLNNFAAGIAIGYAITTQKTIYLSCKQTILSIGEGVHILDEKLEKNLSGLTGVGLMYHFEVAESSPFVFSEIGIANIGKTLDGNARYGFGAAWGVGWDFYSNWGIELDFCHGFPNRDEPDGIGYSNVNGTMLMLRHTWN